VNLASINQRINEFKNNHLYFNLGVIKLTSESEEKFDVYASQLISILNDTKIAYKKLQIIISGYADAFGNVEFNNVLSLKRANFIRNRLIEKGLPEGILLSEGNGVFAENEQVSAELRRRVNFDFRIE